MPDSYRCSDASDGRTEPLLATASQVRGWVLVEVRGAWGEDAIHASALGPHVPADWKDQLKRRHVRAVCIRNHLRADIPDVRLYACGVRRPGRGAAPLWTRDVASLAEVADAMDQLRLHRDEATGWRHADQRLILVCTNGKHDQCCANRGRPIVRALQETRWADRVWECSHIGGDRFAGNVVVLPDSIYFGRVEPDSVVSLMEALDEGRIDLACFRGQTSLSLAEQAVDHFVRRELGVDAIDAVVIEGRNEDGAFTARVGERPVRVRVERHMISVAEPLTCHGRPEQLVPSFTLVSIEG
jgi:hypothetical protein